jgi:hypothetical protein
MRARQERKRPGRRFGLGHIAVCLLVALGGQARAEDTSVEGLGQATVVNGDQVRARERALEEALQKAVEQAAQLRLGAGGEASGGGAPLSGEVAARLQAEIYPRARDYVASYRIVETSVDAGVMRVRIAAVVATERIAQALAGAPGRRPTRSGSRPRLLVCLSAPDLEPGQRRALEQRLGAMVGGGEREIAPGGSACPPDGSGDVSPADWAGRLRSAAAQDAVLANLHITSEGTIRGTSLAGMEAEATLALVGADGARGQETRSGPGVASYAETAVQAAEKAGREALEQAAAGLVAELRERSGGAGEREGELLVVAPRVETFAELRALQKTLGGLPGVGGVVPRRFGPGGVELAVRTRSAPAELGAALEQATTEGFHIKARPLGRKSLEIQMEAATPPLPASPAP